MEGQQAAPASSPGAHVQLQAVGGQAENHRTETTKPSRPKPRVLFKNGAIHSSVL